MPDKRSLTQFNVPGLDKKFPQYIGLEFTFNDYYLMVDEEGTLLVMDSEGKFVPAVKCIPAALLKRIVDGIDTFEENASAIDDQYRGLFNNYSNNQ